jgi:Secretion system C-terminal sorting domain
VAYCSSDKLFYGLCVNCDQNFINFQLNLSAFMKQLVIICFFLLAGWQVGAQHFQVLEGPDSYQTSFNQLLRIPIRIKNNTDKAQFYIVRKTKGELGDTQKGYFCFNNHCLDAGIEEFSKKVEPGETLQDLFYTLESGIEPVQTNVKFEIFPKGNSHEAVDHAISILVEEKPTRSYIFQSKEITIQDIYPNPVQDQAFIDYKIHMESVKAKITLHNILGKPMGDHDLPYSETRLKLQVDDLVPGVYFYTVYLNSNGILTRKLIVRK